MTTNRHGVCTFFSIFYNFSANEFNISPDCYLIQPQPSSFQQQDMLTNGEQLITCLFLIFAQKPTLVYHVLRHTISCKTWAWHQTVCKKNHPFFAPLSIWQIVRLLYLCNFYAPLWWHYRLFSSRSNPILLPK